MRASTSIPASIVIPTRARPDYLAVALASIVPQARAAGVDVEVLVIDDAGHSQPVRALAERFGARYEPHPHPLGLNIARNTGVERSSGELVIFVDDDVEAAPGWLGALLGAAERHPDAEVLTGPIRPRLEGRPPHGCGREAPLITALDLGPEDTDTVRYAWGANMAIRRGALERVGPFDTSLRDGGDEQEWQERLLAEPRVAEPTRPELTRPEPTRPEPTDPTGAERRDGRILYVAGASLDHRRSPEDARLRSLARTARARGRAARRFDARRGRAPSLTGELTTLLGCLGHVVRRRCPAGLTMVAHSRGRLEEGLRERRGR